MENLLNCWCKQVIEMLFGFEIRYIKQTEKKKQMNNIQTNTHTHTYTYINPAKCIYVGKKLNALDSILKRFN